MKAFGLTTVCIAAISLAGCNSRDAGNLFAGAAVGLVGGAIIGSAITNHHNQERAYVEPLDDDEVVVEQPQRVQYVQRDTSHSMYLRQQQVGGGGGNLSPGYYDPGRVCGYWDASRGGRPPGQPCQAWPRNNAGRQTIW
jgi:hypothetical protein